MLQTLLNIIWLLVQIWYDIRFTNISVSYTF